MRHSSKPPAELGLFDVAEALNVSALTAANLLRSGALKGKRVGLPGARLWKVTPADLAAYSDHEKLEAMRRAKAAAAEQLRPGIDWQGQGGEL